MKHIDWINPSKSQLVALLNIMLFREGLGPNGDNNISYGLLHGEQQDELILEFAVAFNTSSVHEFNEAIEHLKPIINQPHLCLMIDVDRAQEALQEDIRNNSEPQKFSPRERPLDFVPTKKRRHIEPEDEE